MKVKNMPGRKLQRQFIAQHGKLGFIEKPELNELVKDAMSIKTKKRRAS